MSYRAYSVNTYGLVLDEEELRAVGKCLCEMNDELEPDSLEDPWEICDEVGLEYITEFTGETYYVKDDGVDDWSTCESPDNVYLYGLQIPKLIGAVYHNMGEIVDECRRAVGQFLPQTFDYRSHIRHVVGVVYG